MPKGLKEFFIRCTDDSKRWCSFAFRVETTSFWHFTDPHQRVFGGPPQLIDLSGPQLPQFIRTKRCGLLRIGSDRGVVRGMSVLGNKADFWWSGSSVGSSGGLFPRSPLYGRVDCFQVPRDSGAIARGVANRSRRRPLYLYTASRLYGQVFYFQVAKATILLCGPCAELVPACVPVQGQLRGAGRPGKSSPNPTNLFAHREQAEADVRRAWGQDPVALLEAKGTPEVHEEGSVVN